LDQNQPISPCNGDAISASVGIIPASASCVDARFPGLANTQVKPYHQSRGRAETVPSRYSAAQFPRFQGQSACRRPNIPGKTGHFGSSIHDPRSTIHDPGHDPFVSLCFTQVLSSSFLRAHHCLRRPSGGPAGGECRSSAHPGAYSAPRASAGKDRGTFFGLLTVI